MSSGGAALSSAQAAHDAQLAYLLGRRDWQAPELVGAFGAQFQFSSTDEMSEAYIDCIQELLSHPEPGVQTWVWMFTEHMHVYLLF